MNTAETSSPIVETNIGKLRGSYREGTFSFKGIPYAAPPVGERRWLPPGDPKPWAGVKDAVEYGKWALQNKSDMDAVMGSEQGEQSEDCLSLNIWTPGIDNDKRPVMVWLHGGGFTIGAGSQGVYEGGTLSRHGDLVVVTINYRLGTLGFVNLNEVTNGKIPATGNEGLLDQVKALEWVQKNIALFGGDTNNVTIFGESAGGMSVGALLALPAAKGLFHKAIPQSGACHTVAPLETGIKVGEALLKFTGLDADGLRQMTAEELKKAQRRIEGGRVEGYPLSVLGGLPLRPVVDGKVIPEAPVDAVRKGIAKDIPILAGSTLDEWRLFGAMQPAIKKLDNDAMHKRLSYLLPEHNVAVIVSAYQDGLNARGIDPTPAEVFMAIQTDRIFRMPAIRLLEQQSAHNKNVYSYLFDWQSPAARGALRACHAIELAYVFGTYSKPGATKFYGQGDQADALAEQTMTAWANFARYGEPGWSAYDPDKRATQILGENCHVENAPLEVERAAWDDVEDTYLGSL
ncbi:MAG: carboxylesterase/lipase family protein [Pseudomonadales bacterium]|nr:carboxylesterase/lipase family protein [Pseudomonadales bacterium]